MSENSTQPDAGAPPPPADPATDALKALRESDKRAIATWVMIVCVAGSFLLLAFHLVEMLVPALGTDLTRCASYTVAEFEGDQKAWRYAVAFFLFAAGVFAQDVRMVRRWRLVVIVAIVGFALAVLASLLMTADRAAGLVECTGITDTTSGPWIEAYGNANPPPRSTDEAYVWHLQALVRGLYTKLMIWFGWVVASQMGLNLDGASRVLEALSRKSRSGGNG